MAEGLVSDHAETFDGYGAAPPGFSYPAGVGISTYCCLCQEQVATALDRHMMNVHSEYISPATPITINTIQCKLYVSQVKITVNLFTWP